jgi:hypothetical protein
LKNILCQIDANGRNFHDERSSQLRWLKDPSTLAHIDATYRWERPSH